MRILSIDIGGSYLKASLLDATGQMLEEKARVQTPSPCPPNTMVDALVKLVKPLSSHNHISIGFPGVVRNDVVVTAPHWHTKEWQGFALAKQLSVRLGNTPARMINDAEMQGLAVMQGKGLELVLTLGTGAGTALFRDGYLMPHLELGQHPLHNNKTYDEYIGNAALEKTGKRKWNTRVLRAIATLYTLLRYDHLFIGGGNTAHLSAKLPENVSLVSNDNGIKGGAMLWQPKMSATS